MTWVSIDKNVYEFAHKNISEKKNSIFSIAMILLVLVSATTNNHSVHSEAKAPNDDSVFYRIQTTIRQMEEQLWRQSLSFLRRKKEKLKRTKCYIAIDETYDSYTGKLHKKESKKLTKEEKIIKKYIHKYKPKNGDTGSFKYLVFALVYGNKRRVLCVKALKRKEKYKQFIVEKLKEISKELSFECALFDRGFYDAKLIDDLQKNNIPFIIRAKISKKMKKIFGIYRTWKSYEHLVSGWANTTLILGKDIKNRSWGFVTNMQFNNLEDVRFVYKKRWNIENIFKATDGIQLRVATANHTTRMFAVCLSFLVYNAWQNKNKRPTLLEFMKEIFSALLKIVMQIPRWMELFRVNQPLWNLFVDKERGISTVKSKILKHANFRCASSVFSFSFFFFNISEIKISR